MDLKDGYDMGRRINRAALGWKLDCAERNILLGHFAPRYSNIVADHVTLNALSELGAPLPDPVQASVVGRIDDGEGVEALVVSINGKTNRPGGGIYHITWSLKDGRLPKESNDLLASRPWDSHEQPIDLTLIPAQLTRASYRPNPPPHCHDA